MDDGKFEKGRKKTGGRKRGTPNKSTAALKEAVLKAFDEVGGVEYLVRLANDDPRTFCSLLGRVIPTEASLQVDASLTAATDSFVLRKREDRLDVSD